ncbi:hypothetical protein [uncultured Sulfitobacter sp.]|uniref:hypothetical protein n=1 Tax=uncultured Sulfitobacter sp. TaxID=191468 RepID=UPI002602EDBA|nr:hypothetical protein [uncultured Sulfitobacter sp.]
MTAIPGAYVNATILVFMFIKIGEHGIILNPIKFVRVFWPILGALLCGVIPAMLISGFSLQLDHPNQLSQMIISSVILTVGALVSGVILHRLCVAQVERPKRCNWSIGIIAALQIVLIGATMGLVMLSPP